MGVLSKVKSATLIEALLATVLIVVIFVVASLILNNLLFNTFSKNTHEIETRLNELEYQAQNNTLLFPFSESYKGWEVEIKRSEQQLGNGLLFIAINKNKNKEIIRQRVYEKR